MFVKETDPYLGKVANATFAYAMVTTHPLGYIVKHWNEQFERWFQWRHWSSPVNDIQSCAFWAFGNIDNTETVEQVAIDGNTYLVHISRYRNVVPIVLEMRIFRVEPEQAANNKNCRE